jgi:hypothetical protein
MSIMYVVVGVWFGLTGVDSVDFLRRVWDGNRQSMGEVTDHLEKGDDLTRRDTGCRRVGAWAGYPTEAGQQRAARIVPDVGVSGSQLAVASIAVGQRHVFANHRSCMMRGADTIVGRVIIIPGGKLSV